MMFILVVLFCSYVGVAAGAASFLWWMGLGGDGYRAFGWSWWLLALVAALLWPILAVMYASGKRL
jgi:hypothetical protein